MTAQQHRYSTQLNRVLYPIDLGTPVGIPSVYNQAKMHGGRFTRITKGLPEGSIANFSPCVNSHNGRRLISWRSQPEPFVFDEHGKYYYYNSTPTDIYVGEMVGDNQVVLPVKLRGKHRLSYEDPRIFTTPDNQLHCQFITSTYASRFDETKHKMAKSPKVCVGQINEFGELEGCIYPPIGRNHEDGATEKNWCFFPDEDYKLRLLYSTIPLVIMSPEVGDVEIDCEVLKKNTYGCATFNSTAPIQLDDGEWLVFYHWKHMAMETETMKPFLMYSLSAYCLDEKLTKISRHYPGSMFQGSTNDDLIDWTDCMGNKISRQPACILPFGAEVLDDDLILPLGVNDSYMGIFRCNVNNILNKMI